MLHLKWVFLWTSTLTQFESFIHWWIDFCNFNVSQGCQQFQKIKLSHSSLTHTHPYTHSLTSEKNSPTFSWHWQSCSQLPSIHGRWLPSHWGGNQLHQKTKHYYWTKYMFSLFGVIFFLRLVWIFKTSLFTQNEAVDNVMLLCIYR